MVSLFWGYLFVVSLFFSIPIGEWPSPPPTLCRTCRTPLSTATMTAAWRNRRLPAASHRLVLASDPWPCLRTTMREPLQMAALARPSTLKTVRWQSPLHSVVFSMNMYLNVNDSNGLFLCVRCCLAMETFVGDLFVLCGRFGVEMLWHPWRWLAVFVDDCVKCYWFLSRSVLVQEWVCAHMCVRGIRAGVSSVSILLISRSSVRHP